MLRGDGSPTGKGLTHYLRVATVHRAVSRIASDLAATPVQIERLAGKDWQPLDPSSREYETIGKVFAKPNPYEGSAALWIRFHASFLLHGTAYLLTDYLTFGKAPSRGKAPQEFRVLDATAVTREPQNADVPTSYRVMTGGNTQYLRPDEVLDHRNPHPQKEFAGVSLADCVAIYSEIEGELSRYQRNFLLNGARGSVVLSTDKQLGEDQVAMLRRQWTATASGASNAGSVWVAANALKVTELAGRKDTDFVDLFRIIKEQVSTAFGVPPAFLSDYSRATYANVEEQTPIYLEGTLFPMGRLFEESITNVVLPRFGLGEGFRARLLWDRVPLVQRMRLDTAKSIKDLVGGPIYSPNEGRAMLGLAPVEGGDSLNVPTNTLPMNDAGPAPTPPPKAAHGRRAKWLDDPEWNAKRPVAARDLARHERATLKDIRAYYRGAEARVLAALKGQKAAGEVGKAPDSGDLFDEGEEADRLAEDLRGVYKRIASDRGKAAFEQVGADGSFSVTDPAVQEFIRDNAYKNGKLVTGTLADTLKQALDEASAEGLTTSEIADRIKAVFDGERAHALTVARTETGRAYNFASLEAWKQTGEVEKSKWLTAQDDAVRDSHEAIDGTEAAFGETFANGCAYPGDPDGEPDETINCRCTIEPVLVPIEERAYRIAPGLLARLGGNGLTKIGNGKHPVTTGKGGKRA